MVTWEQGSWYLVGTIHKHRRTRGFLGLGLGLGRMRIVKGVRSGLHPRDCDGGKHIYIVGRQEPSRFCDPAGHRVV